MATRSVSVLRVPPPPARSVGKRGRARAFARRAGGAVASAAADQKHLLAAGAAAFVWLPQPVPAGDVAHPES